MESVGSTADLRDELQQITTDAEMKQTLKPLACDMINAVEDTLNAGGGKYQTSYVRTNDENICRNANMYGITAVEYFGSIWWARD